MTKADDIAKLAIVAGLLLDHRLATVRSAARAKQQSEDSLKALNPEQVENPELIGASAALAELSYQRWADARRAEINIVLARQTLDWIEARNAAKDAFGKAEALKGLAPKRNQ